MYLSCFSATLQAPAIGAVGAGATLSVGRHTHRRERGHKQTPGLSPRELLCGVTDSNIDDADLTRRLAFLGRACRWHRQLLSSRGDGDVTHVGYGSSICLRRRPVNPA
jgi:hypothetical protein